MTARMDLLAALTAVGACGSAKAWLVAERTRNPGATRSQERWDACPRGDWCLWLAGRANVDRKLLVLAACTCARLALQYVPAGEGRPRLCVETAERWCRGETTLDEVRAARDACWSYRVDADAYASAYAAAAAAAAADAAAHAAYAAAYAAYAATTADAAYAAAAAADAARTRMRADCADVVRAVIPWATVERGLYLAAGGVL